MRIFASDLLSCRRCVLFDLCSASATFGTRPAMKYIAVRNKTSTFRCLRSTVERRKRIARTCATSQSSFSTTNTSSTKHIMLAYASFVSSFDFAFDLISLHLNSFEFASRALSSMRICICHALWESIRLRWDTSAFLFYVLTEVDAQGCHFVAYFSKA